MTRSLSPRWQWLIFLDLNKVNFTCINPPKNDSLESLISEFLEDCALVLAIDTFDSVMCIAQNF